MRRMKPMPTALRRISEADRLVLLQTIAAGNSLNVAAQRAGIEPRALRLAIRLAKQRKPGCGGKPGLCYRLYLDIKRAEADNEARNVALILRAAQKSWQAAAWYLERKYARRWARNSKRAVAAPNIFAFLDSHPEVVSATTAPGAVPALPRPDPLQDRSGRKALGQDRAGQAKACPEPLGGDDAGPA